MGFGAPQRGWTRPRERGPRQRIVAYLSDLDEPQRRGVADVARGHVGERQGSLVPDEITPTWVEVDPACLGVERVQDYGAYWLGLQVLEKLGLIAFLDTVVGRDGRRFPDRSWPWCSS